MARIRYMTAGESHGPALTAILEGLPAGLALDEDLIRADLARRQLLLGAGGRMAIETDRAEITGGVLAGRTTGAPIALVIPNRNHEAWRGKEVPAFTTPRPGHADFAAAVKYGYDDVRPALERASARETAARVAAGACCRAFLKVPYPAAATQEGETLGGVIELTATGLPVGLGSHVSADRRLDAQLAAAMLSVQAIKGIEFGDGFALAGMKGTATRGRMGGLCGGVTDGEMLVLRVAMKPIPTTRKPQPTVDLATGQAAETVYERSDVCPVPRAVVILEAMACLVLADALSEKLGGDSLDEMKPRFAALPRTVRLDPHGKVFW